MRGQGKEGHLRGQKNETEWAPNSHGGQSKEEDDSHLENSASWMQLLGVLPEADSFLKNGKYAFLIDCFSLPPPPAIMQQELCFTECTDFFQMDCFKSRDLGLSYSSYS